MYFANSSVLWALFALAIPVIIHLFNFRKFKRIYFSNVALLREIKIDTQSTNRLKHLLILLCRMLAIACIVLAFANPFLTSKKNVAKNGTAAISIFVDNSFSMNAENKNGILLESAKKAAREIALAYKPSDKFQLLTNDFEGRHQRLLSREEFLEMLDNVQSSAVSKSLTQINSRQADILTTAQANIKKSYILSDFQKTNYTLNGNIIDTNFQTILVPFKANETSNIFIDSVWFDVPYHQLDGAEILNVKLTAAGNNEQTFSDIPIKLYINNEQKALASFTIKNNETQTIKLGFTNKSNGLQQCKLELQDHPITFDDKFYFAFDVNSNVAVKSINGGAENTYINYLFAKDDFCKYEAVSANNIDYSALSSNNFIVVNEIKNITSGTAQELLKFINNGGSLLLLPALEADLTSYNTFFNSCGAVNFSAWDTSKQKVERINLQHPLFNDIFEKEKVKTNNIDLPIVFGSYASIANSRNKSEMLMQLQNGNPFLYATKVGKGNLYVCASPLNEKYSNFCKHALFVPSVYKMAITSVGSSPLFYKIGSNENVLVKPKNDVAENLFHITNKALNFDFIPATKVSNGETMLVLHSQIKEANNYEISLDKNVLDVCSFNYSNLESNLVMFENDELEAMIEKNGIANMTILANNGKSLTQSVKEDNTGKSLWKIFVIFSLLFLLIEVLLLSPIIKSFFQKKNSVVY